MKNDKKQSNLKDALWDSLGEIILALAAVGIGSGIFFLLPKDKGQDIPPEMFFLLGGTILFVVIFVVGFVLYAVKRKKETKDLKYIYDSLKENYDLALLTVTRKTDDTERDIPVLRGKTNLGKFELFKQENSLVFTVEYFYKNEEEQHFQAYPCNTEAAVRYIKEFMSDSSLRQ